MTTTLLNGHNSRKACETLALDLRGHGIDLIAPESRTPSHAEIPPPSTERGVGVGAWPRGSQRTGGGGCDGGGPAFLNTKPRFAARRGPTIQEERTAVALDQVCIRFFCEMCSGRGELFEEPVCFFVLPTTLFAKAFVGNICPLD